MDHLVRAFLFSFFSGSGELIYPSDAEAWSDSGVGDTNLAKTVESAISKLPVVESATGVDAKASDAGAMAIDARPECDNQS